MNRSLGIWGAGLTASVLFHGVGFTALLAAIAPDTQPPQPMPNSELEVQSYQLDRSQAVESHANPDAAPNASADNTPLGAGAIASSRARPVKATPSQISAVAGATKPLAPVRADTPDATAPIVNTSQIIAAALPPPTDLVTPSAPASSSVTPSENVSPVIASSTLRSKKVQLTQPPKTATPEIDKMAQPIKATLAFAGGPDGDVDPLSLAAFQSFVQPGDIQSDAGALRDGVSSLLAQVPCSRLQVAFDPDTATLRINGHIPQDDLRAPVLAALQTQMGRDIQLSDKILILPRPQCGALTAIGNVGLPQSTDQITNPLLIGEDTHARVLGFVKDDRLFFDITAPDYDAYIYADYFDADGNVIHLAPNEHVPLAQSAAQSALRIGASPEDETGLTITIAPPYGQEIAVAFAASEPLYDGLRPIVEPAAVYLEWLKSRVDMARKRNPDFKGEWVYFFVTTSQD